MAQVDLITSVHKGGRLFGTMSVILKIVALQSTVLSSDSTIYISMHFPSHYMGDTRKAVSANDVCFSEGILICLTGHLCLAGVHSYTLHT